MNHDIDRTQVGFGSEIAGSAGHPGGGMFNPDIHANLAADLLDVKNEQELNYFLGDVISGATSAIGDFINSPTGQALGSGLKDVAKQALPIVGTAIGARFGGPVGSQIGGALGTAVAGTFEMASEEQEWEAANTFVKLAGEAAKNAAMAPPGADPQAVAKKAIIEAAKIHAPALVPTLTGEGHCGCATCRHREGHHHHHHHGHSGRWFRHGRRIVLEGV
jgi:hypothetical protein